MAKVNTFERFASDLKIGRPILLGGYRSIFLDINEVNYLTKNGYATNANDGGVVIGKFHSQGGIPLLRPSNQGYEYYAEMEGYEFLLNSAASRNHLKELDQINSQIKSKFYLKLESIFEVQPKNYAVPNEIRKIDLKNLHFQIILLPNCEGNFIVNRYSTKRNLTRLNYLNNNF